MVNGGQRQPAAAGVGCAVGWQTPVKRSSYTTEPEKHMLLRGNVVTVFMATLRSASLKTLLEPLRGGLVWTRAP